MTASTTRIAPVSDPTDEVRALLEATMVRNGQPLAVFATLAHHPTLMKRVNVLGGYLLQKGAIPAREREIVILRTAYRAQAVYEFGQHTLVGRSAGLTEAEIRSLASLSADSFGGAERALVDMVDELDDGADVADQTWAALAERWSEADLLELLMLCGFYRMVAGYLNAAGVQRDPGVPGWPEAMGEAS